MAKTRNTSDFFRSFQHAWRGLLIAFRTEQSFRIQIACGLVMLICLVLFPLSTWERVVLLLGVTLVLVLELLNSTVERLSDALRPRMHDAVRDMKDVMAGAVLLASVMSILIAILIFAPHLSTLRQLL